MITQVITLARQALYSLGQLPLAVPDFSFLVLTWWETEGTSFRHCLWTGPVRESKVLEFSGSGVDHGRLRVVYYLSNGFEECPGDPSQLRLASGVNTLSAHPTPRGVQDTCLGVPGVRHDSQFLLRNCPL